MPTYMTRENNEHQDEVQLETLLTGLLERTESKGSLAPTALLPEIAELRDTARRLRAASQWVPLPEGRLAVRRALMALAQQGLTHGIPGRAAWRRAGLWLSTVTALAAVVGAFGLGAGALDSLVPPSSPAYGLRLALDRARSKIIPGRPDASVYALPFEFSAVQVPSKPGTTATTAGRLGGLPATLSMTTASGCQAGATCGKFVVSVAGLAAPASAKFGELRGTFACEAGGCILTAAEMTGVFARVSVTALSLNTTGPSAGRLGSNIASLGEWRSAVAAASEGLNTPDAPGGGSVSGPAHDHAKRGGRTGKTDGTPNDHPSTSTGHGVTDSQHGHSTAMDSDAPGAASAPDVADDRRGHTAKDKDHPNAPGNSGVADKRQGQDHSKAPGGPNVDNGQRGPGTPKEHVDPSTSSGEGGAHGGTDKRGGTAGASGGSNRGGGATGSESGGRSHEGGSGSGDREKGGSGGGPDR